MSEVRIQATNAWRDDPTFTKFYHETGYVIAASSPAVVKEIEDSEQPSRERGYILLKTADDLRKTMPKGVLTGDFPNWQGWYKSTGSGWVHARKALMAAAAEAQRLGAKFITGGPRGRVVELIMDGHGNIKGALTADGTEHVADRK